MALRERVAPDSGTGNGRRTPLASEPPNPIGSVLVCGGGVAGIQASLDLSASGFRTYLVEQSPAVGGKMARLDKTFPTGDCATCIISPKLVECMRDLNIEVLTSADVTALDGQAGSFRATVRQRARYVDVNQCTACGECIAACPVEIESVFDAGLGTRKAIDRVYAQAAPNAVLISKKGRAPCSSACPIDTSVQGYVALIAAGKYRAAAELIRSENPLAEVCGRVCFHRCEAACNRGTLDAPLDIRSLKRFALDQAPDTAALAPLEATGKSVAIIGSGPAGLSAAHALARSGHQVEVFEALPVLGGMLAVGIPDYRLPPPVLEAELDRIRALGVTFHTDTRVGEGLRSEHLLERFDAIFLSTGTHRSRKLDIPGEEGAGVLQGVDYLRSVALGETGCLGERVVIIGGGNTAIDAARTALRQGSGEVRILYRRSRREMPADPDEIEALLQEGIGLEFLVAPTRILRKDGRVTGVECVRMRLGEPDASGRRRPEPVEGSDFQVAADAVIPAVSQAAERALARQLGLGTSRWGTIEADPVTLETSRPGIFAGGDVVLGPSSVIEAIAHGKQAAQGIDDYLGHRSRPDPGERPPPSEHRKRPNPLSNAELQRLRKRLPKTSRVTPAELPVSQRVQDFSEVVRAYTPEQARAEARRCLNCADCAECMQCVQACKAGAIHHDDQDRTRILDIGAVVLTPGFEAFDATRRGEFGFAVAANVLTNLQFERMLSASGPTAGKIQRPSDGEAPRRLAFIQCVGSRDRGCGNDYCSSVCCMAATKEAILAKEHEPDLEVTVFVLDMRAFGKDFDRYYERARKLGVRYVRAFISRTYELPTTRSLRVVHVDDQMQRREEDFDLVVLSVALEPSATLRENAEHIGVSLNRFGFAATSELAPLETSRPGVFVGGAFQEPKDIPDTVMQASGAAARAMSLLAKARGTQIQTKPYPPERSVTDEPPRIGVFVCHCGSNIASVVNVPQVTETVGSLPHVVLAEHSIYACADDSQKQLRERIAEHGLNRVIVASCTPRTHEPIFRDTLREAGLNPYLLEMVNIRDQCSWVHSSEPASATRKANDLLRMAVARAARLTPLQDDTVPVNGAALIMGGGVAGMTTALAMAEQGFPVHLVERTPNLGGIARGIRSTLDGGNVSAFIHDCIQRVTDEPLITVHKSSTVSRVDGHVGAFRSTLKTKTTRSGANGGSNGGHPQNTDSESVVVEHGVVVVATGAREQKPNGYAYGRDSRVLTQLELSERLGRGALDLPDDPTIVMIQCVEQRNEERPHCSRVCCGTAVKNALALRERHPGARILVLYRDMRTYGFRETAYREAREQGVVFIRHDADALPELLPGDGLRIRVKEPSLGRDLELAPDLLVLAAPVVPRADRGVISELLRVPLNADGFFVEAHMKLRPVDFASEGLFLCGMAHAPKYLSETISQANAVAARAAGILSRDRMPVSGQIAWVDPNRCIACMTCVHVCPYLAPHVGAENRAEVQRAVCMGCGSCTSECPVQAITLRHYGYDQVIAAIEGLLTAPTPPRSVTKQSAVLEHDR